jgi:hypothetical protein
MLKANTDPIQTAPQNASHALPDGMVGCAWCGKMFVARRPWQRFCQPAHKDQYHARRYRELKQQLNQHRGG